MIIGLNGWKLPPMRWVNLIVGDNGVGKTDLLRAIKNLQDTISDRKFDPSREKVRGFLMPSPQLIRLERKGDEKKAVVYDLQALGAALDAGLEVR